MTDVPKDTERCPECFSRNLRLDRTSPPRDIYTPVRKGQTGEPKLVARTIWVRCGRCKAVWSVTRKVSSP